ncbi:MAG: hypothetical protein ACOCUL_01285 [Bacteroidota bacterium]
MLSKKQKLRLIIDTRNNRIDKRLISVINNNPAIFVDYEAHTLNKHLFDETTFAQSIEYLEALDFLLISYELIKPEDVE